MKKNLMMTMLVLLFVFLPALAEEQKTPPQAGRSGPEETVVKTYTLRFVSPAFIKDALRIYFFNCSFGEGSNLISVAMHKNNVADFEAQLRKLDVEKKTVQLRIFTVIAGRDGRSETIENKDLKRVLSDVSNLLSFTSYVLDGASSITVKEGTDFGRLALSSSLSENFQFDFREVSILTGSGGKRSVKMKFYLKQKSNDQELLRSETEIAENGYLVAGVSRLGVEGRSLVLVINAEIR